MTKSKFVPFAILLLFFFSFQGRAQLVTNKAALQKAAIEISFQEKYTSQRLIILARQKGWPLFISNRAGRKAMLSGIDPIGNPLYVGTNDLGSAASIKTNTLWPGGSTGLNLSGSSANMKGKLAIWDEDSVKSKHQELINRILQKDHPTGVSDHTTHVTGILMASGVNPQAKGMSFGLQQILAYDFNNHLSEMSAESPNILVSNHSYGTICGWNYNDGASRWEFWGNFGDTADYKFGFYSTEAQVWDSIAYNAPYYLIVKSAGNNRDVNGPAVGQPYFRYSTGGIMVSAGNRPAGLSSNDGYDIIPTYGTAKNILTVGAANPVPSGYTQPSDVSIASFSSWGPTDDGRIKPDVVTDGINVLSSIATSNNAYAIFSGTSMSSPAAAGSVLLLQEYYSKLHAGSFLRSATLKGIVIHTTDETGPSAGPDYQYGWGLMNMQKAAAVITSNNTDQLINENNLVNGNSFTLPVVASGKGSLVATLSWTDPAATPNTGTLLNNPAKKLINDLDLRIVGPDSTHQPYVLNPATPAAAAFNGDNVLDNVEKIVIDNVIPGQTYTLKVTHKGTLARGQQAYSLLVSGVGGQAYCASNPLSTAGTKIDSVGFGTFSNLNSAGCKGYSNFVNKTVPIQASQAINFAVKLGSCDASNLPKVVKIYIDYNNNGLFTDPGETVAQSTVIAGNGGIFTGSFTSPAGLTIGNYSVMRIVAVESNDINVVNPCGTYSAGETQDYRIQIVKSSKDAGVSQLVDPEASVCAADSQRITIRIKNYGTDSLVNVPISTVIKNGATTVSSLSINCPVTIPALSDVIYTFQAPFTAVAGATYTVTSTTNLIGDQDPSNDQNISTIVVSTPGPNPVSGLAEICGSDAALKANVTDSNDIAVWYDNATATKPVAIGNKATTTVIPSNKTYYMALNDVPDKVGPPNKKVFTNGGYNEFAGNFVKFTNTVPVTIHSARLYIGNAGTITFTVADIVNFNPSDGSFSYFPISSNTLNVYPTTPNPEVGAVDGNDAKDTGAVYYLNLPVPTAGNHAIIIECKGATIFRNNNIATNPYPFTIPGVFAITGNSAQNTANTADTTFYRKYYYFFYNMSVVLANCATTRTPIVATTGTPPVISLVGKELTSNVASGNQWYFNDTAIAGATGQTQTIGLPGIYKDVVVDAAGCNLVSNLIVYTPGNSIGLIVGPNPNSGQFNVQFYITESTNVSVSMYNAVGQRVYSSSYPNFSGAFSKQINVGNLATGVYFLKIQTGNKNYAQRILIK